MDTMKVKILKDCAIAGVHTPAGKVVTLLEGDAKELISMGRAEPPELTEGEDKGGKGKGKSATNGQ